MKCARHHRQESQKGDLYPSMARLCHYENVGHDRANVSDVPLDDDFPYGGIEVVGDDDVDRHRSGHRQSLPIVPRKRISRLLPMKKSG